MRTLIGTDMVALAGVDSGWDSASAYWEIPITATVPIMGRDIMAPAIMDMVRTTDRRLLAGAGATDGIGGSGFVANSLGWWLQVIVA
jgi:hypothetical protein